MLVCVVLAGCSQESLEIAQRDISAIPEPSQPSQPEEPILPAPPPKGNLPNPAGPSKMLPLPSTGGNPAAIPATTIPTIPTEPAEPKPPNDNTKPAKPAEPTEPELTPEEIRDRKLISDNPQENLEVLNQALDAWLATHDELPEKIADLVMGEHLPMLPMAPPGERFEIDRVTKRIVLVTNN